ncbi:MAG TPA: DEAD/DEAH box helicase, partial [Moorella mulderi]|nr:DEAD/DEAH box helicase [Moorella mulderi]
LELFLRLWQDTLSLEKELLRRMLHLSPPPLRPWFEGALSSSPTLCAEAAASAFNPAREGPILQERKDVPPPGKLHYSIEDMASHLAPGGSLSLLFPGYEHRLQQIQVLKAVARALEEEIHLVVEAGTGTGKSWAYLLPAIYWACSRGERVVIATHTISLQEQLLHKDLPVLKRILPFEFRAALLKGRGNYLCRRKLKEALEEPPETEGERAFLMRVLAWFRETSIGDWNELKLTPEEEAWKVQLSAEKETCIGSTCPHFEECFFNKAREEAEGVHILLINHSLLLSDLRFKQQILPDYFYLVIDEAHHLEEVAFEHLGITVKESFLNLISRRWGDRSRPSLY